MHIVRTPSDLPKLPADCIVFWNHYLALPREKLVPSLRSFLDSPPIALMPRVVIVDANTPQDFRIRYFGTGLSELIGKDFTGVSTAASRAAGLEIGAGNRGWDAITHPCGYLSKRVIFSKTRRTRVRGMIEILALAFPLIRTADDRCVLDYYGEPRLLPEPHTLEAGDPGQAIHPICWIDIGAGAPDLPL